MFKQDPVKWWEIDLLCSLVQPAGFFGHVCSPYLMFVTLVRKLMEEWALQMSSMSQLPAGS